MISVGKFVLDIDTPSGTSQQRPSWLHAKRLLGEHGIPKDSAAGRRELERRVEALRRSEEGEELERLRWNEAELHRARKADPAKLAIALRLRAETVMSAGWIANRLKAGTRSYLNRLLYKWRRSNEK